MINRIAYAVVALAIGVIAMPAGAQSLKQLREQVFCNTLGIYASRAAADHYNHVPLDQSLRRVDGYICSDDLKQVCNVRVSMIQESMRTWYTFAQQHGYETLQPDAFASMADAIKVNATSACWMGARQHYGW